MVYLLSPSWRVPAVLHPIAGGSLVPAKGTSLLFLPFSSTFPCPSCCLPRCAEALCARVRGRALALLGEAAWLPPGSLCKGESKGSQNECRVLISQAAPHSQSESGTGSTLLILHRPKGIFFFPGSVLSLFCVLKSLKLGLVRSKPWLEALWGELALLMHVPHSRYSSAWQKKGGKRRGAEDSGCKSPSAIPVLCLSICCVHSVPTLLQPLRPSVLQQGSAAPLLWPELNEGCAFEHENFQSVNYREHLQLLFTSQHCLCASPGCHPGWEQGALWWMLSPVSSTPLPEQPWGVQNPEHMASEGFGVWVLFP